jgi:glycerophosphoryl diester phosphodiesterase
MVYGGTEPVEEIRRRLPDLRVGSREALKNCLFGYFATGWIDWVPASCRDRLMLVPVNVAPWLWGWSRRFFRRMEEANAFVFMLGDYDGSDFSTGIDTPADLARLPKTFSGGIWTNRIEVIANAARRQR